MSEIMQSKYFSQIMESMIDSIWEEITLGDDICLKYHVTIAFPHTTELCSMQDLNGNQQR